MRLPPFIVLVLAVAANADKLFPGPPGGKQFSDRFNEVLGGYLPPSTPKVCEPTTVTRTSTTVVESTRTGSVPSVITQTGTTTIISSQVVPTTILTTSVINQGQTRTETVAQTQTSEVIRSVISTFTAGGGVSTVQQTVISTQRQVSTAIKVQTSTAFRDSERTVSSVVTEVRPTTITRREDRAITSTVSFQPPAVVKTEVRTSAIQSTVVREGPVSTIRSTAVVPRTITSTVRYQPPGGLVTSIVTSSRVDYTTQITTSVVDVVSTRERVVSETSVTTVVRTDTQPQIVSRVTTQLIPTTIVRTQITTQLQGSTVFDTRTETRTVGGTGNVVTSTYVENVVRTVGEQDQVITRSVATTRVVERVSTVTQGRASTITVARTQQLPCGNTGYNYDAPVVPFNLPN